MPVATAAARFVADSPGSRVRRLTAAAPPANAIQRENAKPGTTEWKLTNPAYTVRSNRRLRVVDQRQPRRTHQAVREYRVADVHAGYLSHGVLRRPGRAADDEYRDASRQSAGHPVTRSGHRPGRVQLAQSLRARHPQRRRSDGVDERHLPREADRKRRTQAAVHRLYGARRWPALGSDHGADREHVSGLQRVGREIALRHDREPERHREQSRQGVIRPSVLQ